MQELDISTEHCLVQQKDRIMIITLNRPEKKNALSPAMLIGMYQAWRRLDEDDELLCAVLTGAGNTFCAGMDLKQGTRESTDAAGKEILEMMKKVPNLHWQSLLREGQPMKPIFLAVEGYALAGGTEILLGTDIRIGAEDAVFGVTEVVRGTVSHGRFGSAGTAPDAVLHGRRTGVAGRTLECTKSPGARFDQPRGAQGQGPGGSVENGRTTVRERTAVDQDHHAHPARVAGPLQRGGGHAESR